MHPTYSWGPQGRTYSGLKTGTPKRGEKWRIEKVKFSNVKSNQFFSYFYHTTFVLGKKFGRKKFGRFSAKSGIFGRFKNFQAEPI